MILAILVLFTALYKLTRSHVPLEIRKGMFARRIVGLAVGFGLALFIGPVATGDSGLVLYLLVFLGPILLGEWQALSFAKDRGMGGVDGPRTPTF